LNDKVLSIALSCAVKQYFEVCRHTNFQNSARSFWKLLTVNNSVNMTNKINEVTAIWRDAVFVCFVVAIVASPASKYGYPYIAPYKSLYIT